MKTAVTGAFGYSGRYITQRLLDAGHSVITLTNSTSRENPFGARVRAVPFHFDQANQLAESLAGIDVLINTYWVRFNHRNFAHAQAVQNSKTLFQAAKDQGYGVFISPHYLYPHDQAWQFGGLVEKSMLDEKEFYRPDPIGDEGFVGSGADWLDLYKPFIEDGNTVVVSPHKVWGPQSNDLVLQLRKRFINKVILAGMLANLCVESHLRELLEQGFEVAVVKDATAAPRHPQIGDGYKAAVVNYGFLANAVLTAEETVKAMR